MVNWKNHIEINKSVLAGKPTIKGTLLSVSFILELMGAGSSGAAILASYPQLTQEDIRACLHCASEKLGESTNKSSIDDWIARAENDYEVYRG